MVECCVKGKMFGEKLARTKKMKGIANMKVIEFFKKRQGMGCDIHKNIYDLVYVKSDMENIQ